MSDRKRIEIGFSGGQVVSLTTTSSDLDNLYTALADTSVSWHRLETEDGTIAIDIPEVVFVHAAGDTGSVGFSS